MLIAVTTSDGKKVDTHFGRAERFLVYEVGNDSMELVHGVQVPAYCDWNTSLQDLSTEQFEAAVEKMRECADAPPAHSMMPDKLAAIARALGDCRVVVTAMIGDAPRDELERLGIDVITVSAPVKEALLEVAKLY